MPELLVDGFRHLCEKFPVKPSLLAVTVPPFAHEESDTSFWLNKVLQVDWGNYCIDLAEHFEEQSDDSAKPIYRLASYVAYQGEEDVTPTWTFISGHFVAYFREGDAWYQANDSKDGRAKGGRTVRPRDQTL